jgi:hypothetical protein
MVRQQAADNAPAGKFLQFGNVTTGIIGMHMELWTKFSGLEQHERKYRQLASLVVQDQFETLHQQRLQHEPFLCAARTAFGSRFNVEEFRIRPAWQADNTIARSAEICQLVSDTHQHSQGVFADPDIAALLSQIVAATPDVN